MDIFLLHTVHWVKEGMLTYHLSTSQSILSGMWPQWHLSLIWCFGIQDTVTSWATSGSCLLLPEPWFLHTKQKDIKSCSWQVADAVVSLCPLTSAQATAVQHKHLCLSTWGYLCKCRAINMPLYPPHKPLSSCWINTGDPFPLEIH